MIASAATHSFKFRIWQGVLASLLALTLAGCSTTAGKDRTVTGSIPKLSKPVDEMTATELSDAAASLGKAYDANPKDRDVGVNYANVLRMSGRNGQALAVMQQVAIANPDDRGVLAAYGKAQAAAGQLNDALSTIERAQTPDRPDWRLVSAQGAILDQLGRSSEARAKYHDALDIQPNEPSILSNLGMSYVLTSDLKTAETYLRSAVSPADRRQPRTAEPCTRRRPARSLSGSRTDRAARTFAAAGRRQRRLPARHDVAAELLAETGLKREQEHRQLRTGVSTWNWSDTPKKAFRQQPEAQGAHDDASQPDRSCVLRRR